MNGANLWQEFKRFALKGNVIDLAVAVVIGSAFGKVVNSLANNILMPLLSYLGPAEGGYRTWHIGKVEIGAFLGEVLNFVIIAGALFVVMVKAQSAIKKAVPWVALDEPATKECPFCLSAIPFKAKKCAHCTADLPEEAAQAP